LNKNTDEHHPVEFFIGNFSDFADQFTWLLTFEDDVEEINYSENVLNITGYDSSALRGTRGTFNKIIHEDDLEHVRVKFNDMLNDFHLNYYTIDYRIKNEQNNIIWVRETVKAERNSAGKLKNVFGIIKNVSDLKNSQVKLLDEIRKLEEMNSSKDDFIAILSHDLRSPFTSILGFSEILLNEADLPEAEKNEYLTLIHSSSQKQLRLVNNLLDWSRLRTGRTHLNKIKVDTRNAVYNSVSALTGEAVRKNIEIRVYIPGTLNIEADETLFCKVVLNLIENSIKFSSENKNIDVKTSPFNDKFVEFIIRDKGKGISENNKHKIFQINKIFSTDGTHGEKGTGLGLVLCKEIVEQHGGEMWFFSEPEAGSEFHFTFPLFKDDLLLVAIDNETTDKIQKVLEEVRPTYSIRKCSNGFEAVDAIKEKVPTCIVVKDKMQLMDGLQFARILQSENRTAGIPLCLLVEEKQNEEIEHYHEAGINKILIKPINVDKIKTELMSF
jgi:two-component system, sensor histidine kinase and response regulator